MKKLHLPIFLSIIFLLEYCQPVNYPVETGLDRLVKENFSAFENQRVGIICNHTACDKNGKHVVDLLFESSNCVVTTIFSPEHGFRGDVADGREINNSIDSRTGARIFSLYGEVLKPTPEMLDSVDILVYDIQDVGVRFYTYISTMSNCMEAAAEKGIPFYVLDRPNPIGGTAVEGAMLDKSFRSFVGKHKTPVRYGLTAGELARYLNEESMLSCTNKTDLHIVPVKNWKRSQWYDETDLPWIAPSPNMPDLATATVYPGFCLLEGTNLSEGRGSDSPFLLFGAPWLNAEKAVAELTRLNIPGITFSAEDFTPVSIPGKAFKPKHENILCHGIRLSITDRKVFPPVETAAYALKIIHDLHPDNFTWKDRRFDQLCGDSRLRTAINNGTSLPDLFEEWRQECQQFKEKSQVYYLYD